MSEFIRCLQTISKKEEPSDWLPDFVAGDELATRSYLK